MNVFKDEKLQKVYEIKYQEILDYDQNMKYKSSTKASENLEN